MFRRRAGSPLPGFAGIHASSAESCFHCAKLATPLPWEIDIQAFVLRL
jgi:hypothetical protein